jgi:Ca2+-binding EF-hand superfamily protein
LREISRFNYENLMSFVPFSEDYIVKTKERFKYKYFSSSGLLTRGLFLNNLQDIKNGTFPV